MSHLYSDDQLRLVARLYYIDGIGQNEVAKFAKVSQAKVSRLLAMARERGIVRITVADYEPRRRDLEDQIQARFGLTSCVVIKAADGLSGADLRRAVGHFGASVVEPLFNPGDIIALAGGRTIHDLVHSVPSAKPQNLTVVQAMGSVDSTVSAVDAQEVGRVLAQRLGGSFLALNTPAFIPDRRARETLLELPQVRTVHQNLDRATLAIVGLGTLANSVFVERGTLDPTMIAELRRAGAVGEICGRFIDESGRECATGWKDRVISIGIEQLRRIPQVIAVVSGSDRSAAITAAVKGGMVKSLIIDELGAAALLGTSTPAASTATPAAPRKRSRR